MWNRRVGAIALMVLFVLQGITVDAAEPPSHRLFSSSEQDITSVVSYFSDILTLCEDALYYSYVANATVLFNGSITTKYDLSSFEVSKQIQQQLEDTLSYHVHDIHDVYEYAESYEYIQGLISPTNRLVETITNLLENHSTIVTIFGNITDITQYNTIDRQKMIEFAHKGISNILFCEQSLLDLIYISKDLSIFYSMDTINKYITSFGDLFNRYQIYFREFLNLVPSLEPEIYLFTDKPNYYVGENISITGYFISNNSYIENQQININLDDILVNESLTDENGSFQTFMTIPLILSHGRYQIIGETQYQDEKIISRPVNITISLLPTLLKINPSQSEYSPGEKIIINGRLSTKNKEGLKKEISLDIGQQTLKIFTNDSGYFQKSIDGFTTCGRYPVQCFFESNHIYASSYSQIKNISINYPVLLSLQSNKINASVGDTIKLSGHITNASSDKPLSYQTIHLLINGKMVNETSSNETGWYYFIWNTDKESEGVYDIQTVYISKDITLRNSKSNTMQLQLTSAFLTSLFNLAAFFFQQFLFPSLIILVLIVLFYVLKRTSKQKNDSKDSSSSDEMIIPDIQSTTQSIEDILIDRYKRASNVNQKIINQYHLFIHHLIKKGIPLTKAHTHLEIQETITNKGYPSDPVNSVTITFEQAQYAPYIAEENDLIIFDDIISNLLNNDGVIS